MEQLVLLLKCRSTVLKLSHDIPAASHLGINKTKDRVLQRYYWPGVFRDVANHCRTCEICQRAQGKRYGARAEMIPLPLIEKPFQRIAMDIIRPLPRSNNGNKYILTICDYATRYPEAIPIPNTEATTIAKELVSVFARVGIPDEILTDQGSNLMSSLLQEMYFMLNISRLRTFPYHPQTDGLTERLNGTPLSRRLENSQQVIRRTEMSTFLTYSLHTKKSLKSRPGFLLLSSSMEGEYVDPLMSQKRPGLVTKVRKRTLASMFWS